ncbi:hypothetical protein DPMN_020519, partial [Dreissena polymorpha]
DSAAENLSGSDCGYINIIPARHWTCTYLPLVEIKVIVWDCNSIQTLDTYTDQPSVKVEVTVPGIVVESRITSRKVAKSGQTVKMTLTMVLCLASKTMIMTVTMTVTIIPNLTMVPTVTTVTTVTMTVTLTVTMTVTITVTMVPVLSICDCDNDSDTASETTVKMTVKILSDSVYHIVTITIDPDVVVEVVVVV